MPLPRVPSAAARREPLAIDLLKRLLSPTRAALLGPAGVVAQPVELGSEVRPRLRKRAVAFRVVGREAFDIRLQRLPRCVVRRPRLFQFLNAHLRGQQRGRALLQRGFGAGQFGLHCCHFRLRRYPLGLDLRAQCVERAGRVGARPIP